MSNPTPIPQAVGAAAVPATPMDAQPRQPTSEELDGWDDLTTAYMAGFYDGKKAAARPPVGEKWRDPDTGREVSKPSPLPAEQVAQRLGVATPSPASTSAPAEPTDAMVDAYLRANDAYWKRTDELPTPPNKWRTGSPREATRESLRAVFALAGAPDAAPVGDRQQWKRGDEFLPFHPSASHVPADYRDGWNRCYWMSVRRAPDAAHVGEPAASELLAVLQLVQMDAVRIGSGENAISNATVAKVDAVLAKLGASLATPTGVAADESTSAAPDEPCFACNGTGRNLGIDHAPSRERPNAPEGEKQR